MHCHICDSPLTEIQFNSDHEDIDPCNYCLTIIQDAVGKHVDKAAADEDALPEEDWATQFLAMYGFRESESYQ